MLSLARSQTSAAFSRAFSTAAKPSLNFLVIDGYSKEGRLELEQGGAGTAGKLYEKMLTKSSPSNFNVNAEIVYPSDAGFGVPSLSDLEKYDGVAWTGCSLCIYDETDNRVKTQLEIARRAYEVGVPSFGSCWAVQIAATAAGGICRANPKGREMGIARKIQLTPEGRAHPMYEGKPTVFEAFISHLDEVTHLPVGGVHLASNPFTRIQAASITHKNGTFWGLQYHPEYDLKELARLTYCRIDKLMKMGFFNTRQAGEEYVKLLETLHADPSRKDIAWMLGIDEDVMSEQVRLVEVRNWVKKLVIPSKKN
eukprot:GILI01004095.1.p1 GENE.GILI01004095.1~~GILI01004095.1.p1  ORF type:complete len:310 (+),score=99.41 GILI01004095.1:49-978(+)